MNFELAELYSSLGLYVLPNSIGFKESYRLCILSSWTFWGGVSDFVKDYKINQTHKSQTT